MSLPVGQDCCRFAFLSAAFKSAGVLNCTRRRWNLALNLQSYQECLYIVDMLKSIYPTDFEIEAEQIKSGVKKGTTQYSVIMPSGYTKQALEDMKLVASDGEFLGFEEEVPEAYTKKRCCAIAYLKGLFLAIGGIYVPSMNIEEEKKDGYHFELKLSSEESAQSVLALLALLGTAAKMSERGSNFLVYIKDKEEIFKLLAMLEFAESALKLRAVIDERETANSINRVTICETANLDKTFAAASKHLLAIGIIEERDGLDSLAPALRDTASARMEYQQASLGELAEILGITKSCLNHRLRKLVELAGSLADSFADC